MAMGLDVVMAMGLDVAMAMGLEATALATGLEVAL